MATGQVLFHRFFYSKSFVKHSFEVSLGWGFVPGEGGKERGGGRFVRSRGFYLLVWGRVLPRGFSH